MKPFHFVMLSSTLGTVIEWYDLFVYGSLVVALSSVFFPKENPSVSLLYALGAFVAGAAVRPFGGAVFGRLGDILGRKYVFLITLSIMGAGAVLTGLLPTYSTIGILAPILLVAIRIAQGLALGGEYGGAAVFIAEHAPDRRRGYWTGYVQATATLGLLLSSLAVLSTRIMLGPQAFSEWGWRLPFLLSSVFVIIGLTARLRLTETPLFTELVKKRKTSNAPIRESLMNKPNLLLVLLATIIVAGSSVVWHTAQFYSTIFMQTALKMDLADSTTVTLLGLALGAPFFVFFGWLSDRVGRRKILLLGNLLAAIFLYPLYVGMKAFSNPPNLTVLGVLFFAQVFFSSMTYGPLAAYLVELFPTRIRSTSMSIPYGVGTGVVGDGTLLVAPSLALATGGIYAGLLWCVSVPLFAVIVGVRYVRETVGTDLSRV